MDSARSCIEWRRPTSCRPVAPLPNLKRILSPAISSTSKDDGWSNLGEVGSYLIKSHAAFVAACDRFIYLDLLRAEPPEPAQSAPDGEEPAPPPPNLKRILSTAIGSTSKDDGWSNLGEVGSYLVKSHAAFDPRDYGHPKLGELVRAQSYVDVKDVPGPTGLSQLWVRLKPGAGKGSRTR